MHNDATQNVTARVSWTNTFTSSLVGNALKSIGVDSLHLNTEPSRPLGLLIQWSTYDALDHSLTLDSPTRVLSSSYVIRKALIRKHFLHRTFVNYIAKQPSSLLAEAVPKTWDLDLAFADELDELWGDELWDLGEHLDQNLRLLENPSTDVSMGDKDDRESQINWYILKPGMADRGMGIRLFKTRQELQSIFEEFDDQENGNENGGEDRKGVGQDDNSTSVATSQLRHFVIQEYLRKPVLIDPIDSSITKRVWEGDQMVGQRRKGMGRKFHLRVYCVAYGALKLYISPNILALFSAVAYTSPKSSRNSSSNHGAAYVDLEPHLTNTCLQDPRESDNSVRLLSELIGCPIYSSDDNAVLMEQDVDQIVKQVGSVLAETFKAALQSPVHFQSIPNAFEIFGADLLVTHLPSHSPAVESNFRVHILELNAEPAFEMTGSRLKWILDELFDGVAKTCVLSFIRAMYVDTAGSKASTGGDSDVEEPWGIGETRFGLRKCLDVEIRSSSAW